MTRLRFPRFDSSVHACLAAVIALTQSTLAVAQPAPAPSVAPSATPPATPTATPAAPTAAPSAAPAAAPPAGEGDAAPTAESKEEARKHFEKGLALVNEQAWAAALAEFLLSIELFPTRSALYNAAFSYQKLQRFDDALDAYEKLLRDFPNLAADTKTAAQKAVTELRGRVGTVDVTAAEPGATIVVSGQSRGEYPPVAPLRVAAGSHVVRVFKEGFEPFEQRIDVAGGQTVRVEAKLAPLASSGRLKVSEQSGRAVEVVVDNIVMGNAPWEGLVSVGNHVVVLREAGGRGRFGTQPVAAPVKAGDVTQLSLRAQELDSTLRVEPRPPGATVFVNGVDVGRGQWVGRLKSGKHKVEIFEEGFERDTREVALVSGGREIVSVELKRDDDAARWKKPSKWVMEANVGLALGPSFGGDVGTSCGAGCQSGLALGPTVMAHGAYELGSGFGLGVSAGYLLAFQEMRGRTGTLVPQAENQTGSIPPVQGDVDEAFRFQTALVGLHVSYRIGETFPVVVRLGGGIAPGQLRSDRTGSFPNTDGTANVELDPAAVSRDMTMAFVAPEVRIGWRFAEHFEATLGVRATVLIATEVPRWNEPIFLNAGAAYGTGRYSDESLTGPVMVLISPTLGIRYDM